MEGSKAVEVAWAETNQVIDHYLRMLREVPSRGLSLGEQAAAVAAVLEGSETAFKVLFAAALVRIHVAQDGAR